MLDNFPYYHKDWDWGRPELGASSRSPHMDHVPSSTAFPWPFALSQIENGVART